MAPSRVCVLQRLAFTMIAVIALGTFVLESVSAAPPSATAMTSEAKRLRAEAKRLAEKDRYREAIPFAEKFLALQEQQKPAADPVQVVEALVLLADIAVKNSELTRAEGLYDRARELGEPLSGFSRPLVVDMFYGRALIELSRWDFSSAETSAHLAQLFGEEVFAADSLEVSKARLLVGVSLRGQGKFVEARKELTETLAIRERRWGSTNPNVAEVLDELGQLDLKEEKPLQARKNFERALSIRDKAFGPDSLASTDSMLGLAHFGGSAGIQFAQRALAIREKMLGSEHYKVGMVHGLLGTLYLHHGNLDAAKRETIEALRVLEREFNDIRPGPRLLYAVQLVGIYRGTEEYVSLFDAYAALQKIFDRALEIFIDPTTLAEFLLVNGIVLQDLGEYAQAESALRRGYTMMREHYGEDNGNLDAFRLPFAEALVKRGNYADAEPLMLKTIRKFEQSYGPSSEELMFARLRFGMQLLAQRNIEAVKPAMSWFRAVILVGEQKKTRKATWACAQAYEGLASAYLLLGKAKEAESPLVLSLHLYNEVAPTDSLEYSGALMTLSLVHVAQGDIVRAEEVARRAFKIDERGLGQDHPEVGRSLANLSEILLARGRLDEAVTLGWRAVDLWERNAQHFIAGGSEEQRRSVFATLQQGTDAAISMHVHHAPANTRAAELAMTVILRRKGRVIDAVSDTFSQFRRQFAPEVQRALLRLGDVKRELDILEHELFAPGSKLEASEFRAAFEHQQELMDERRSLERDLEEHLPSRRLRDVQREIAMHYTARKEGAASPAVRERVQTLETERESLERDLSSRNADVKRDVRPIDIAAVRASIPDQAALVEIVAYRPFHPGVIDPEKRWGKRRYAAYVLHQKGNVALADLGDGARIDVAVDHFRKVLSHPDVYPDATIPGRALDVLVMAPIRRLLDESRHVFISPDGALNLVPFGALVNENGRYLLEEYDFTYLTSGRDLMRVNELGSFLHETVIFGDPDFGALDAPIATDKQRGLRSAAMSTIKFPRLRETAAEARGLAKSLPGARVLLGEQATEGALKALQRPRILHLATHGFFLPSEVKSDEPTLDGEAAGRAELRRENRLLRSGVALAGANIRQSGDDDGILTALEVSGLNLDGTNLVTLSACQAAVGDVSDGDGVYGLRRALVLAGSETQVLSLWNVDDAATRELMVGYYQGLSAGIGRSAAMRDVALSILRQDATRHPYFWASFVVSGDWRSLDGKDMAPNWGKVRPPPGCACEIEANEQDADIGVIGLVIVGLWCARRGRAARVQTVFQGGSVRRGTQFVLGTLLFGALVSFSSGCGGAKHSEDVVPKPNSRVCDLERAWTNLFLDFAAKQPLDVLACRVDCRAGVRSSCVAAGLYYDKGVMLPKDQLRAKELFEIQCTTGYVPGCAALGRQFAFDGDEAEAPRGVELLDNACTQGEMHACAWLGQVYAGVAWRAKVTKDEEKAAALYRRACEWGDAAGCNNLGVMYMNGTGVPADLAKAAELYQRACERGNAVGCYNSAALYSASTGAPTNNEAKVAALFQQACEGGMALGCSGLGFMYHRGSGVPKDLVKAAALYQQACDGNVAIGCSNLGIMYQTGSGVPPDLAKSVTLARRACDGGAASGCGNLGFMYNQGYGVPKNATKAAELYKRACEEGDANGCSSLGALYQAGAGVPTKDDAKAAALFQKACEGEIALGCSNLGFMYERGYGIPKDVGKAVALYQRSCEVGDVTGCNSLGAMYEKGYGIPKDVGKAVALYQQACDGGAVFGCNSLGAMYENGYGIPKDETKAVALYQQSCERGTALGCNNLAGMYHDGTGIPKDEVKAAELYRRACDEGLAHGCNNLGYFYEMGIGGFRDEQYALVLYRRASRLARADDSVEERIVNRKLKFMDRCASNDWNACVYVGVMYSRGNLAQPRKAMDLFKKACDHDSGLGCYFLGRAIDEGLAGPTNPVTIAASYERACKLKDGVACVALGFIKQMGPVKDTTASTQLYKSACNDDVFLGCARLGKQYDEGNIRDDKGKRIQDQKEALRLFQKACGANDGRGCYFLAQYHAAGHAGLGANPTEAAKFFVKACDFGEYQGCLEIGKVLRQGIGAAKDAPAAADRFEEACDYGHPQGCKLLADMLDAGEGRPKDFIAAKAFRERAKRCKGSGCPPLPLPTTSE